MREAGITVNNQAVFLRGVNDKTHDGWYHDRPPRALIEALDYILVDTREVLLP